MADNWLTNIYSPSDPNLQRELRDRTLNRNQLSTGSGPAVAREWSSSSTRDPFTASESAQHQRPFVANREIASAASGLDRAVGGSAVACRDRRLGSAAASGLDRQMIGLAIAESELGFRREALSSVDGIVNNNTLAMANDARGFGNHAVSAFNGTVNTDNHLAVTNIEHSFGNAAGSVHDRSVSNGSLAMVNDIHSLGRGGVSGSAAASDPNGRGNMSMAKNSGHGFGDATAASAFGGPVNHNSSLIMTERKRFPGKAALSSIDEQINSLAVARRALPTHATGQGLIPIPNLGQLRSLGGPCRQRSLNDLSSGVPAAAVAAPIARPNSIDTAGLGPFRAHHDAASSSSSSNSLVNRLRPDLQHQHQQHHHHHHHRLQNAQLNRDFYNSLIPITPLQGTYRPHTMPAASGPFPTAGDPAQTIARAGQAQAGGQRGTVFMPMLTITHPDKTGKDFTPIPLGSTRVASLKFSPHYHGMHTENNASLEYLKPEQNCALWLTNLPPDTTEGELLAAIRNVGRIFATYINRPDFVSHSTSAAKVVFFTPEAAQRLLASSASQPLVLRGFQVKMALNRIKYARSDMDNGESRVLIVTGHQSLVNEGALTAFFEARFAFQIDSVQTLIQHKARAVVEYRFGSYRCQSQMGMKALLLDCPPGLENVEYGADPCEVGSDTTCFTIAGERIQGKGLMWPTKEGI